MKKLLTFLLLIADAGLLVWIVTSEPYDSGAHSLAYSQTIPEGSVSQGLSGTAEEQYGGDYAEPAGEDYSENSEVFPEVENLADAEESPAYPETEGSVDSFLLGEDYGPGEDSGEEASDGDYSQGMEESAGQDFSQGSEYADEDSGYYGEEETGELSMEDFAWYETVVRNNQRPEGAEFFTDFGRMKGGWKAYIEFDPDNSEGRHLDLLLYVNITGEEENVSVECDWYWQRDLNTGESEYDESDSSFYYGNYDEGEIFAAGAGNMRIRFFWEKDGTEYAIGTMESQAGVEAMLVMMR